MRGNLDLCSRFVTNELLKSSRGSTSRRARFWIHVASRGEAAKPTKRRLSSSRTNDHGRDAMQRGARPLYFQKAPIAQKQQQAIVTPYDFAGTSRFLPPNARHLSPCLGAALSVSPLLGNLLRLGQRQTITTISSGEDSDFSRVLAKIGFLANNLFFQMIRESPIHLVRNKSMPAYYLAPDLIGCFLGHTNNASAIREALRRDFGIKSNRIHDTTWTGISMARWMDLAICSDDDKNSLNDATICHQTALVSALWLIALWGTATCRENWIQDYSKALQQTGIDCAANSNNDESSSFAQHDFDSDSMRSALSTLVEYYSRDDHDDDDVARSLELVCAAIVLQRQPPNRLPPPVPNGYYSYDGGDTKADCAEVTVREIVTLLLWDDARGCIDPSKLPATASKKLGELLQREVDSDVSSLGQDWFDLLSDLPECDYLATSPNKTSFELAPTVESISKSLWHLLLGDNTDSVPWTSVKDLATFWNHLPHTKQELLVQEDRLVHRSQSSDNVMEHEFLSLQLSDSPRAMEVRLRCDWQKASGMAAVTHLARPSKPLLDPIQVRQFCEVDDGAKSDPSWWMLRLALQSEYEKSLSTKNSSTVKPHVSDSLVWLATPYGSDRRELTLSGTNDGEAFAQSRSLLKDRIILACDLCESHPESGAHLLSWILEESPAVIESSSRQPENSFEDDEDTIIEALLSLPPYVLNNETILEAIEWNWASRSRGRSLVRMLEWKLGKLSMWQVLAQSKLHELSDVASFYQRMQQRKE